MDILITAPSALVGVESKRFEPFRDKPEAKFSDAFWRPKWGGRMDGFLSVRDALAADPDMYARLKADHLVKHALALRALVNRQSHLGMTPVLVYLYAEPDILPNSGKPIPESARAAHRREIADFANRVADDEGSVRTMLIRRVARRVERKRIARRPPIPPNQPQLAHPAPADRLSTMPASNS